MGILEFKRILKDIGLYKFYISCRERQGFAGNVFTGIGKEDNFACAINRTLRWAETSCPFLWDDLFCATALSDFDIAKDESKMEELRNIVKKRLS